MDTVNEKIACKLNHLMVLLEDGKQGLENLAEGIRDLGIKMIVNSVADENFRSLKMLQSMVGNLHSEQIPTGGKLVCLQPGCFDDLEAVFDNSLKIEQVYVSAYRDILNQWFPQENLRRTLQFQLNGIKSGFMKLRLFTQMKMEDRVKLGSSRRLELA